MDTNMKQEYVVLPSDAEEREITKHDRTKFKVEYVRLKSSRPKIYTQEEIAEFSKGLMECQVPRVVWERERSWNQLIASKGSEPKW